MYKVRGATQSIKKKKKKKSRVILKTSSRKVSIVYNSKKKKKKIPGEKQSKPYFISLSYVGFAHIGI
jgi:hypothetical protein